MLSAVSPARQRHGVRAGTLIDPCRQHKLVGKGHLLGGLRGSCHPGSDLSLMTERAPTRRHRSMLREMSLAVVKLAGASQAAFLVTANMFRQALREYLRHQTWNELTPLPSASRSRDRPKWRLNFVTACKQDRWVAGRANSCRRS